jgi:hypothetical protein
MTRSTFAVAGAVVAATLAHDALVPAPFFHPRSTALLVVAVVIGAALLALAPRARSRPLALGAGIAAGGAFATAIAGFAWRSGVPDPLTGAGVAFNLGDIAIAAGDALMLGTALSRMWTRRATLRAPI